jgi:hypothetical protein
VATEHYLQITNDHFDRAVNSKAAHNPAQQLHETIRTDQNQFDEKDAQVVGVSDDCATIPLDAEPCDLEVIPRTGRRSNFSRSS